VVFVALGYTWSDSFGGLVAYLAIISIALAGIASLAWLCVRVAHFSRRATVVLTTFPFIVLTAFTVATLPALAERAVLPLLFWAVQLAAAMFVANTAIRRAAQ
jgi:hypothetical protein